MDKIKDVDERIFENGELIEQTFKYWFSDHEHIRSPFPDYVHFQLKEQSTEIFIRWVSQLDAKAKDEISDEIVGEKFEEIIFETAIKLVKTEDEKITLFYPFLPRIGDKINDDPNNESKKNSSVIERDIIKEGDVSFLKIVLENELTKDKWDTQFELPV